jgi:hypothetical protein
MTSSTATRDPDLDTSVKPAFETFLAGMKDQPVYVILGVQGSGTNLLRSILTKAFNFSVVQDQSLIYNAAMRLGATPSAAAIQGEFDALYSRMLPSALGKTGRRIKTNGAFEGIDTHFDPRAITLGADLARFIYAYSAFSRGSTLMAIKSDDLWETISHIDTVLPNRRIILLTRDFRDNLLSITNKNFGPIEPLIAAHYVKERFSYYEAEYRRTPEDRRLHVRYEEMLESPDEFVARFGSHFRVGVQGQGPAPVDKSRIRRHNVRKWAGLSARQLAHCEAVLWDELRAYGYESERGRPTPPGAAAWMVARMKDAVRRVPQKIKIVVGRLLK